MCVVCRDWPAIRRKEKCKKSMKWKEEKEGAGGEANRRDCLTEGEREAAYDRT